MSEIWLDKIRVKNYRSFGSDQVIDFPDRSYGKPVSIIGYNNAGKTNLLNAILYGIGEKFVSAKTFEIQDLHKLDSANQIEIKTRISATAYGHNSYGEQTIGGDHIVSTSMVDSELKSSVSPSFFGANKHYKIFYINFHDIKSEISTKKTSWGNLTSFLAKHIQHVVEHDTGMSAKKEAFKQQTKQATDTVLDNSNLSAFIEKIKQNYAKNLRDNNCVVQFGMPEYEDIFLEMVFKIGLNGDSSNLVSIDHFGDGYISMFVMAVIQAIAEENTSDKCLFLFEEPESFLHENHQEYFYKMVLCRLAEKGHQVIYSTHSAKMIDIFDTKSIVRLGFNDLDKKTEVKYNNVGNFNPSSEPISLSTYNGFIKSVEPNLNKILFSQKVVLVEGPNDLLSYKFAIEKKVNDIVTDAKYAAAYLNFNNISIVPHHGKSTAHLLIELCRHFGLDVFVITDADVEGSYIPELNGFNDLQTLQQSTLYLQNSGSDRASHEKASLTTNWKLIKVIGTDKIHFNVRKLEEVIGYPEDDKDSVKIWGQLNQITTFSLQFFPAHLSTFLGLDELTEEEEDELFPNL
jgi:putative ATP-dependent endonuclease of OLD family